MGKQRPGTVRGWGCREGRGPGLQRDCSSPGAAAHSPGRSQPARCGLEFPGGRAQVVFLRDKETPAGPGFPGAGWDLKR